MRYGYRKFIYLIFFYMILILYFSGPRFGRIDVHFGQSSTFAEFAAVHGSLGDAGVSDFIPYIFLILVLKTSLF